MKTIRRRCRGPATTETNQAGRRGHLTVFHATRTRGPCQLTESISWSGRRLCDGGCAHRLAPRRASRTRRRRGACSTAGAELPWPTKMRTAEVNVRHAAFDLPVAVLRPFTTAGPRQSLRTVPPSLSASLPVAQRPQAGPPVPAVLPVQTTCLFVFPSLACQTLALETFDQRRRSARCTDRTPQVEIAPPSRYQTGRP